MILVESTEGSRVIYSIFDMAKEPAMEYRDAMPEVSFKATYSYDATGAKKLNERWTWHDKTPFPWDRIIKNGIKNGARLPSADHTLTAAERIVETRKRHISTAAERVAAELKLQGENLDPARAEDRMDRFMDRMETIFGGIARALSRLPTDTKPASRKTR
jgi:hypothetical protein